MKNGDLCRVRTDVHPLLPWATPGSIVQIVDYDVAILPKARLLFGAYRDEGREQYAEDNGYLLFNPGELEVIK